VRLDCWRSILRLEEHEAALLALLDALPLPPTPHHGPLDPHGAPHPLYCPFARERGSHLHVWQALDPPCGAGIRWTPSANALALEPSFSRCF